MRLASTWSYLAGLGSRGSSDLPWALGRAIYVHALSAAPQSVLAAGASCVVAHYPVQRPRPDGLAVVTALKGCVLASRPRHARQPRLPPAPERAEGGRHGRREHVSQPVVGGALHRDAQQREEDARARP